MVGDIHLAFAHPIERSVATERTGGLDRISVRDHVVPVDIGAFQEERGSDQRIRFNIVVEVIPQSARIGDDVDKILSYDKITDAIAFSLGEERLNLLETLAERIAERILVEPQAERAFIRIEKLDRGPGALGVEIERDAADFRGAATTPMGEIEPRLVFVPNVAASHEKFTTILDTLVGEARPVLLCVGVADSPMPPTGNKLAQRRIDLLSIEQNAWKLAARDPRCVVIATKTELEHSFAANHIALWAPSKLVLDAVDSPTCEITNGLGLMLWLAKVLGASDLSQLDATPNGALALTSLGVAR